MGLFSEIKDAKANQGGVYPLPGNYICKVQAAKVGETRKKDGFFVADLLIVSSDNDSRAPGTVMSWMAMSSWDGFQGLVKAFLMGAMGLEDSDITEEVAEMAIGEDQPLAGLYVKLQATNVQTKKGADFTRCVWFPVSEEEVAAAKAA